MIKAYKCIMTAMLLCPTVLTGCSDEKNPLEQEGEKELPGGELFQPWCRDRCGRLSCKGFRDGIA